MKTPSSSLDYRFLCVSLSTFLFATLGALALAVVWVRQSTTSTSKDIQRVEAELQQVQRKLHFVNERYAIAHMPASLVSLAKSDFIDPTEAQRVFLQPENRMPAVESPLAPEPFMVSFELAFLDSTTRR